MRRFRLAFMGTPDFAVPSLKALLAAGHEVAAVYSQPPRPAGRGQQPRPSPVARLAAAQGIPVRTPVSLKTAAAQEEFAALNLDAAVVVAYGLILPKPILDAPRLGCINIHASLLPRWRGAAPIQRAIEMGDKETGVTIMAMDEGLDTGPVILEARAAITPLDTAESLHDRLADLGASLIAGALEGLDSRSLLPRPQPSAGATYARKIDKAEARIDWTRPAAEIERRIRAFNPVPGAWFEYNGTRFKVLRASVAAGAFATEGAPGAVIAQPLVVACGKDALRVHILQKQGKAAMDAEALLRGTLIPHGASLAAEPI